MNWKPFRARKTRAEWRERVLIEQRGLCAICGHRFPEEGELSDEPQLRYAPTFHHSVRAGAVNSSPLDRATCFLRCPG